MPTWARSVFSDDVDFDAAIRADVPGRDRAGDADHDSPEYGRPEASNNELTQKRRDQPEHGCINDEQKQSERHNGDGKRHQHQKRTDNGVDESQQQRRQDECTNA
mgnify:CR=1 FL=1